MCGCVRDRHDITNLTEVRHHISLDTSAHSTEVSSASTYLRYAHRARQIFNYNSARAPSRLAVLSYATDISLRLIKRVVAHNTQCALRTVVSVRSLRESLFAAMGYQSLVSWSFGPLLPLWTRDSRMAFPINRIIVVIVQLPVYETSHEPRFVSAN